MENKKLKTFLTVSAIVLSFAMIISFVFDIYMICGLSASLKTISESTTNTTGYYTDNTSAYTTMGLGIFFIVVKMIIDLFLTFLFPIICNLIYKSHKNTTEAKQSLLQLKNQELNRNLTESDQSNSF